MLKNFFKLIFILISLILLVNLPVRAEEPRQESYLKAKVVEILEEGEREVSPGIKHSYQKLKLQLLDYQSESQFIQLEYGGSFNLVPSQKVKKNETVVLSQEKTLQGEIKYFLVDKYRLGNIAFLFFLFFLAVVLVGGLQGITSMAGMLLSLLVILKFIVPRILAGANPLLISILASIFILVTTLYLAHGINQKTHLAVLSTSLCLILTGILAALFVQMALLTGLGSEEAYSLTLGQTGTINFKGLLLGGIIIGALGSLDDVTTGQTASIFELHQVNPKISFEELFKRGLNIGKEHVAAMVNTLVLAYAGASLALFLLFYLGAQNKPFWMIFNSEVIAEEIIRAIAGSLGLVLAVPITTFLTVSFLKKK